MRLLLMDTCGAEGSVALADTEASPAVLATESLPGRSSSERLVPVVRALIKAQAWSLSELTAIVVVHGPGSFTGVRVGLSAAKGLSEASGVPLIAVSRLAVLAAMGAAKAMRSRVRVALDAGRGEFYYGDYDEGRCAIEGLFTRVELEQAVGLEALVICEGRVAEALAALRIQVFAEPRAQDALDIARARVDWGLFDDAALLDANYLRRTDEQLFARSMAR